MNEIEFKRRTKQLALRSIRLVQSLTGSESTIPNRESKMVADVLGKQLLRSATSVGANYRAVCRAKSAADMVNKLRIVEEEADESIYWIELITESGLIKSELIEDLKSEFNEIVAMVVSSQKTLRNKNRRSKIENPK